MMRNLTRRLFALLLPALLLAGVALAQPPASAPPQQQPAAATRPADATKADYVLGPGDVIRISVFQSPDLSVETRISDGGTITYPLLGQVKLGGLTVRQAELALTDGLRKGNFIKQPQVSVLVSQIRSAQVSVLGMVVRPGKYPLDLAQMHLSDVLAQAGGVAPGGSDIVTVTGKRAGQPYRAEVDLPNAVARGGPRDDVVLENGDVVYVDRAPTIYVYGEVQRPGAMRLERGMTVRQALAGAGGLTLRGTEKGLKLHRKGSEGKTEVVSPTMDDLVRDGDVLQVRESLF
jgi:polysaccharide export outer membrane protein